MSRLGKFHHVEPSGWVSYILSTTHRLFRAIFRVIGIKCAALPFPEERELWLLPGFRAAASSERLPPPGAHDTIPPLATCAPSVCNTKGNVTPRGEKNYIMTGAPTQCGYTGAVVRAGYLGAALMFYAMLCSNMMEHNGTTQNFIHL